MGVTLYRHVDYERQKPDWIIYRDLYDGCHDVMSGPDYLWYHGCEQGESDAAKALRSARVQRTRYLNLPEIIVSLWVSLLLRKKPKYGPDTQEMLESFGATKNVDGQNTGIEKFIKKLLESYIRYGKAIVLTDSFGGIERSIGDEQAKGKRPFLESLAPLDVVDWDYESSDPKRIGKLNMLRYEYRYLAPRQSSTQEALEEIRSKELTLKDGKYTIQTYRAEQTKTDGKTIPWPNFVDTKGLSWETVGGPVTTDLDEIPVAIIEDASWINDVCQETLRCHNLRSNKDNIQYNQGYRKHFGKNIKAQTGAAAIAMNEYNLIDIGGGDVTTIEPVTVVEYETAIANSIDYTFKLGLNMLRMLPSDSKLTQSDDTMSEEKDNIYALAETTLTDFEAFVGTFFADYATFGGKGKLKDPITFEKKLSDKSIQTFTTIYNTFRDNFAKYPTIKKEIDKVAVSRMGLPDEVLADAFKEIETTEEESPEDIAAARGDVIGKSLNGRRSGPENRA